MVKSVLGSAHVGLRDWLIQRISAIVMAVYTVALVLYIIFHPGLSYPEWHALFSCSWVKVATMIFTLFLLLHAWVGVWTILTDYIKPFVLRFVFQMLVLLSLVAFFFAGLQILWGM